MILEFSHRVPASRAAVFAFHTSPANLSLLLDGWAGFELLEHGEKTEVGCITTVQQRFFGILPIVSAFEHTEYSPPERFAEKALRGPFQNFHHVHEFEEDGAATIVRDKLDVRLRWFLGGEPMTRLFVGPFFARFFAFRHASLDRLHSEGAL